MIEVNVTEQHIKNGIKEDSMSCAVACALKEMFPNVWVSVESGSTVYIGDDRFICLESAKLDKFIDSFDKGTPVDPTKFELSKYEEYD